MLPYIDSIWVESNNDDFSMATYEDIVSVKFRAQEGLRMPYVIMAEDTAIYEDEDDRISVSYTHLTLPTNREV